MVTALRVHRVNDLSAADRRRIVVETLASRGFVRLDGPLGDLAFLRLAGELGEIVDERTATVVPRRGGLATSPEAIPLHTDDPRVDVVAWRCEAQDAHDGAALLLDGRRLVRGLDAATRDALARTFLAADVPTPILSVRDGDVALYYVPSRDPLGATRESIAALQRFRDALATARPSRQRLLPGQVLLVDNHRMLHGRGPILERSGQRLHRLRIARTAGGRR